MTADSLPSLPERDTLGHKGTFGTVAIVGGCDREGLTMLGAPLLAGRGAIRSGVGLCRLCVPRTLLTQSLAALPAATGVGFEGVAPSELPPCDAAVIGPGLGPVDERLRPVFDLIKQLEQPAVIDADGLNAIASGLLAARKVPDFSRCILTPHPGEYDRLARACRLKEDPRDPRARESAAYTLASRLGTTVVLKGAGTVVSDGSSIWVCQRGHPCMATGGTGDVLAGVLGGLLAQNVASSWDMSTFHVACTGVQAHAAAGEAWAKAHNANAGMLAEELADFVPESLRPNNTH
ncbi:MAG: NAD(P)H-hydrate dehydratase [Planctomycetota bacterium]